MLGKEIEGGESVKINSNRNHAITQPMVVLPRARGMPDQSLSDHAMPDQSLDQRMPDQNLSAHEWLSRMAGASTFAPSEPISLL